MFESGYDDLKAHAARNGAAAFTPERSAWDEFSRAWASYNRHMVSELSSDSEVSMMSQPIDDQLRLLQQKTGDSKWYGFPEYLADQSDWTLLSSSTYEQRRRKLERAASQIRRLQKQFPGEGFETLEQIRASAQEETRKSREAAESAGAVKGAASTIGMIGGMITGGIRDPIMAGSMVFGASPIVGGTVAANAWRAFKTEALIGGLSEAAIQPFVSRWKEKINNPISVKEQMMAVVFATLGAGGIRAAGSAVVDLFQISKINKLLNEKRAEVDAGNVSAKADVDDLERYLHLYSPLKGKGLKEEKAHIAKIEEAQDRMELGLPPRLSPEDVEAPGRALYEVDPREIEVDARMFQFKEAGDAEGVTDALTGVTRWDPELANTVMIWERADGKRFIADGHQRLALAKRAIADGQNPDEVKLQAMIYREADGFTPEIVRAKAAYRNISMGTGSVLDAAKMIREASVRGMEGLPILPPRGRLTKSAEGLARLDDEAFQMVVNGIGDPRHAAIVGRLIDDPHAQRAAINELAKAEPANLNQAELMVHDMNRAGFVHTETVDLFGGQEMAETLFKERAQVIDAVMKGLRKDRGLFRTLEARSSTITEAGNVLDRAGNIQRLSEDERILQVLTSLANSKGPVSEAINEAARKVKEGATPASTAGRLLQSVKRASAGGRAGRIDDAEIKVGDGLIQEAGKFKSSAEEFKALGFDVILKDLKGVERDTEVVIPTNKVEIKWKDDYQNALDTAKKEYNPETAEPVDFIYDFKKDKYILDDGHNRFVAAQRNNQPIKGKIQQIEGNIEELANLYAKEKGISLTDIWNKAHGKGEITADYRGVHTSSSPGEGRSADDLSNVYPDDIYSEGAQYYGTGGADAPMDEAAIEIIRRLKGNPEGIVTVYRAVPDTVDTINPGDWVTISEGYARRHAEDSGWHIISEEVRAKDIFTDGDSLHEWGYHPATFVDAPAPAKVATPAKVETFLDRGAKQLSEDEKLEFLDDVEEAFPDIYQTVLSDIRATGNRPETLPMFDSVMARLNDHSAVKPTGRPGIDAEQRLSSTLKESGLDLGDPSLDALHAGELRDVQRLLDQEGDTLELPTGLVLEEGETVVNTQTLRSVFNDLDAKERAVDDLFTCTLQ